MGLGTPKFPVQWVLGSSELTEEENSDKNNFVYIKNTFDKKLFFFHGKDENENKIKQQILLLYLTKILCKIKIKIMKINNKFY
uniref:Uncharacterized protein n=1 Tax=Meloidogyne incognita TaxID=6306 RepID=A0A914KIM5_MELIC